LQSQLPNAQIRLNSGQPGTAALIRSRGPVSATGNTTPVIYVDGVRVDNRSTGSDLNIQTGGARSSSIADIPLENIERIEFVKGGAATTLYGSDAANGVIQIFTRDGSSVSQNQFNFETRLGAEYGVEDYFRFDRTGDIVFDSPALVHSYKLSGAGSSGGLNYSFSGKMYENNAARIGNENIRYDLNTKISANPIENLQYSGSVNFVSNYYTRAVEANFSTSNLRSETGLFFGEPVDSLSQDQFSTLRDSLQRADELYQNETEVRRWQTAQTLRYSPIPSLTANVTAGLDYRTENNKAIETNQYLAQIGSSTGTSFLADFTRDFLGLTLSANLNHETSWRFLTFRTNVGAQVFRDDVKITRLEGDDLPDGTSTINAAAQTRAEDDISTVSQRGFYIKENIGFGDRFFVDFGLRGDENSAFGDEIGVVWYPSIGASYTLTDEPFIAENIPQDIITNVKLRGNYGESGNFPDPFANDRLLSVNSFLGTVSYTFAEPGDPSLKPERVKSWEVGGDFAFIDGRITLSVTRYNSTTVDALFDAPFAPSAGQNNQQRNLGEIENKGWEFTSSFAILDQANYGLNLNASLNTLTNEVIDNGPAPKFGIGGFNFLGPTVDEGQPVGYLETNQPVYNEDGEVVDIIVDDVAGNPNPDYFGSLSLSARYKGLSLRTTADYQLGAQGVATDDVLRLLSGIPDADRFPNPNNEPLAPAVQQVLAGEQNFFNLGGAFVEDTDYLKVRLISLNYRVPQSLLPNALRSLRVGVSASNPFNFVSSSFDPEVSGSENGAGTVGSVFGYRTISPPRQFTFSVNVGL
jgi:TonB-dependent SusC/RagA subfamily outer membrane receptor